jgi:hypothetical protein
MQSFTAKVVDIKSGATYRGVVYDQWIVLALDDGKKITLFDHLMLADKEMIGKSVNLEVHIFSRIPIKTPERKKEIVARNDYAVKIQGEIIEIGEPDEYNVRHGVLDAGAAKFLCDCDSDTRAGDFVVHPDEKAKFGHRLDLRSIKIV